MVETLFESISSNFFFAFCCVLFNAFFVTAEFALVKVRSSRLQELSDTGSRRAQTILKMLEDLEGHLAATQFGITLMSVGLGGLAEPSLARMIQTHLPVEGWWSPLIAHTVSMVAAFIAITYFQIVLGELVPRVIAIRNAERVAILTAPFVYWLRRLLRPLLAIFDSSAKLVLRAVGVRTGTKLKEKLSEEELRLVLIESIGKGAMTDTKMDLIDNVFDFSKRTAKQIMIARDDIVSLDFSAPIEDNLAKAKQNNHTRYPLCEGSIDHVIGLINFKDVLWQSEYNREHMDLQKIKREILFVPETKPLTKLLKDFQRNKIHMSIVIDEFGVTIGLVTLEDVLEELVGDIQDEYDQEVSRIQLMRDGSYMIEGSTLIEEVEEKLGIKIEKLDNTTIAGAILSKLGKLPRIGDVTDFENFSFIVKALKGRRIYSVMAIKKAKPPTGQ